MFINVCLFKLLLLFGLLSCIFIAYRKKSPIKIYARLYGHLYLPLILYAEPNALRSLISGIFF